MRDFVLWWLFMLVTYQCSELSTQQEQMHALQRRVERQGARVDSLSARLVDTESDVRRLEREQTRLLRALEP